MTPARSLVALVVAAALAGASSTGSAQTPTSSTLAPAADLTVPTTKVLAIGRFTTGSTPDRWRPYLDAEVRQTVELYLAGRIEQWWVKPDQSGVVFLFASRDVAEVQSLLDQLPMGRAHVMQFELIPLGPLSPLRRLLVSPEH